jgi:hypothetical protein
MKSKFNNHLSENKLIPIMLLNVAHFRSAHFAP